MAETSATTSTTEATDGSTDGSTTVATTGGSCGDGVVDPGEACDDGNTNNTDPCTNTCEHAVCGDSFVHEGEEQCDDGNQDNADECTNDCTFPAKCGDGTVQADEECDDGNQDNADACTNSCKDASCGDGIVQAGVEACDEAGESADCNDDCTFSECGDGVLNMFDGEECDDGNTDNTDACTDACDSAMCGDSYVQEGESCDDGNQDDNDGCDSMCRQEWSVFVTSDNYKGSLGGLDGADTICQGHADGSELLPGGTYMAWLSNGQESPGNRFSFAVDESGVFKLVDGTVVDVSWDGLLDGGLMHGINLDEKNNLVDNSPVWTNTTPLGGAFGPNDCNDWSSESDTDPGHYGKSGSAGSEWTANSSDQVPLLPCNSDLRLYCFQVPL